MSLASNTGGPGAAPPLGMSNMHQMGNAGSAAGNNNNSYMGFPNSSLSAQPFQSSSGGTGYNNDLMNGPSSASTSTSASSTSASSSLSSSSSSSSSSLPASNFPQTVNLKTLYATPGQGQDPSNDVQIIEVWSYNLHEEMAKIVALVDDYNYIAMDTEFPGIVSRPAGSHKTPADYHYKMLKTNVDLLKVIQVGLFFCDAHGNALPNMCCWQFNFTFKVASDIHAPDSIRLLEESGIDFKNHEEKGIDVHDFGEVLMTSGVVLNDQVKWITFHAGYDYGYLLKVLTCAPLPADEEKFFELLSIFFPSIYDIKYMMRSCENLRGGLQKVAEALGVERVGPQHQAGSDAMLTAATFFKMREDYFEEAIDDDKYLGVIFGLGAMGNGSGPRLTVGPSSLSLPYQLSAPSMNSSGGPPSGYSGGGGGGSSSLHDSRGPRLVSPTYGGR